MTSVCATSGFFAFFDAILLISVENAAPFVGAAVRPGFHWIPPYWGVDAGVLFGLGLLNRAARRFLRVFRRSRFDHQLDARLGSIPLETNTG